MNAQLLEQVCTIAADTFSARLPEVTAESSPDTLEGWDSLTHLNFLFALEQAFGLTFSPEEGDEIGRGIDHAVAVIARKTGG